VDRQFQVLPWCPHAPQEGITLFFGTSITRFILPSPLITFQLDEEVARAHLEKLDVRLTSMSKVQSDYLGIANDGPYKPEHYRY
jgi:hypothetical protein